jgi:hypothetical protein
MRKDLLHAIANLASTQGYKKAKEAIEKWDKETDVDRYWAMRIANIAADEKLGIQAARHAIDNPDQWDCRTESEKMADSILGYNAHFDPDYRDNPHDDGLIHCTGGGCYKKGSPATGEECSHIAAQINADTRAILKHPDMGEYQAIEHERFMKGN